MPICGWRARISWAARSPSSVCVGGMRTSTMATSGRWASIARSSSSGDVRLRHHLDARARQQRRDAFADEDAVVRDDYAHGSSAVTVVPAPGGTDDAQPPVQRRDAIGQPAQARAAGLVGAADAVVGDLDHRAAGRVPDAHGDRGRLRVLGDVGQRLGGDEVGGELDRLGQATRQPRTETVVGTGERAASDRAPRRGRGRAPRGGSRAPARAAPASDWASWSLAVDASCSAADGSSRGCGPAAGAAAATSATRRCCAPSCRLRSRRRRSASPAATMRSREACTSASRACGLGVQALVLQRDARRGAHGVDQLGVVVERGVVDERGDLAPSLSTTRGRRGRRRPAARAPGRPSASA